MGGISAFITIYNILQPADERMNFINIQRENKVNRVVEIDYLKAIFILLMIVFHLAYFADGYPYLKQFVYTFHMSGFLIISGYLMNVGKTVRQYGRTILWLAVPYVVMEAGYVGMASVLPVKDHIENLTLQVFFNKLLVNPLGPYWYLHTLILCGVLYFVTFRWIKASAFSRLIVLGLLYYMMSLLGPVALDCSLYFWIGIAIRQSGHSLLDVFRKSWWSFVVLIILFFHPETFNKASLGGILIVYFIFSFLLTIFPFIPEIPGRTLAYLGRNSLVLYIFSPVFTLCCKVFIPYLWFDSTRMIFMIISLPLCVLGCTPLCKLLDLLHISSFLFGREHVLI